MRYFTDNPLERMMMQVPRQERGPDLSRPAKGHPCHGCKRYGEGCILPCYRGVMEPAAMKPKERSVNPWTYFPP